MTASPGHRGPNPEAQRREYEYAESLIDLTLEDLSTMMPLVDAVAVDHAANSGADILQAEIDETSLACRMNTGFYEDEIEDYIADSPVVAELIAKTRREAGHTSAEQLRLLRSARAVKAAAIISGQYKDDDGGEEPAA